MGVAAWTWGPLSSRLPSRCLSSFLCSEVSEVLFPKRASAGDAARRRPAAKVAHSAGRKADTGGSEAGAG